MSTLEQDLDQEHRRLIAIRKRAERRLAECVRESSELVQTAAEHHDGGDAKAAASAERRRQKLAQRGERYRGLIEELSGGRERLVREVLLARLQGPESELLLGEAERSREQIVTGAIELLTMRDRHRSLRGRWIELNDKIRLLRQKCGLAAQRTNTVDFRVHLTPATYKQPEGGPTFREVADLLRDLGF